MSYRLCRQNIEKCNIKNDFRVVVYCDHSFIILRPFSSLRIVVLVEGECKKGLRQQAQPASTHWRIFGLGGSFHHDPVLRIPPPTEYILWAIFSVSFSPGSKKSQKENRRLFGSSYTQNNGEVFTWPDGRPSRLDYITNLLLKGYSIKEVQKWVGQEDVETTIRIYNRVKQKEKTRIVKTLDTTFQNTLSMQKC